VPVRRSRYHRSFPQGLPAVLTARAVRPGSPSGNVGFTASDLAGSSARRCISDRLGCRGGSLLDWCLRTEPGNLVFCNRMPPSCWQPDAMQSSQYEYLCDRRHGVVKKAGGKARPSPAGWSDLAGAALATTTRPGSRPAAAVTRS
jgi:hypothetical protein